MTYSRAARTDVNYPCCPVFTTNITKNEPYAIIVRNNMYLQFSVDILKGRAGMATPNKNLKAVFEYLGLTNLAVAKALNIDPSLISRYLSGHRQFKVASPQMELRTISDQQQASAGCGMLKERFKEAGLPTDMTTVRSFKQNLIYGWRLMDTLRRSSPPPDVGLQNRLSLNRRQYGVKLMETQNTVIWSFYSRWSRS